MLRFKPSCELHRRAGHCSNIQAERGLRAPNSAAPMHDPVKDGLAALVLMTLRFAQLLLLQPGTIWASLQVRVSAVGQVLVTSCPAAAAHRNAAGLAEKINTADRLSKNLALP
jgi:hypothetical protein